MGELQLQKTAYIRTVHLPGVIAGDSLQLAYPTPECHNVINVLCGANNSGKTYVLRELRKAIEGNWPPIQTSAGLTIRHDFDVDLVGSTDRRPEVLFLIGTWKHKDMAGVIPLEKKVPKKPQDIPFFETALLKFIARQVCFQGIKVAPDFWPSDPDLRTRAVEGLKLETELYLTDRDDPAVVMIETTLDANLYFRKTGVRENQSLHLELVLVYGNHNAIPYSRWSDGQKAFCYLTILLSIVQPDILLLDELENHLHPTFMSKALELIRSNVPQSLICTHHPHVIFSELVDKVLYIDTDRNALTANPERILPYKKMLFQTAPSRTVLTIGDDFDRLFATYHLFHHQDRQLLKQAGLIARDADLLFYSSLRNAFLPDRVAAGTTPYIDTQSKQLADYLAGALSLEHHTERVTILDFGCGLGRVPREIGKDWRFRGGKSLRWICWEPDDSTRLRLKKTAKPGIFEFPESLQALEPASVDLAVMVNVIHHLNPAGFSQALLDIGSLLIPPKRLVIVDLYPLLSPETFAVAYSPTEMIDLLHSLEFEARVEHVSVRNVEAYVIVASFPKCVLNISTTEKCVAKLWQSIKNRALRSYKSRRSVNSYKEYVSTLQELTTLASIAAFEAGEWMS